ncbi:mevalonate kinase family protein [Pseudomonas sp. PB3P13]
MGSEAVLACAPGKIILMGEHAALHGCPVFATSVGLYCKVQVRPRCDGMIEVQLPALQLQRCYRPDELRDYIRRVRQLRERYQRAPDADSFARVRGADADHLVKCAIGESLLRLARQTCPGFTLRVESSIPLDAGFGSSGALAVSLSAALLCFFGLDDPPGSIEPMAMSIESFQHGQPSGIDHHTSLLGSTVERRPMADGGFKLVCWPAAAMTQLRDVEIYHTGASAQSTGQVIAATRHRLAAPDNPLLASMRSSAERFRLLLQQPRPMPEMLKGLLRDYEASLERLGVVPLAVAKVIRAIEKAGGAAKICGAGALSGDRAGALLVVGAPPLPELQPYHKIDAAMAVEGLQVWRQ